MKRKTLYLLLEAFRRLVVINRDTKPLGDKWLGLGTEAEYRPAVKDGYMRLAPGASHPQPRSMGWWALTPKGEAIIAEFKSRGLTAQDFHNFDFTSWAKIANI